MKEKKLIRKAERIARLENKINKGLDTVNAVDELEQITANLSPEEMMFIDDYIEENKLVKGD